MYRNTWFVLMVWCIASGFAVAGEEVPENLIKNGGFELPPADALGTPAEWTWFSSGDFLMGTRNNIVYAGEHSFHFKSQEEANTYCGICQHCSVSPDKKYTFSVAARRDKKDPLKGSVTGRLVVEWHDQAGHEISRADSDRWNRSLSSLRWTRIQMVKIQPPKGTVTAVFGIHLTDNVPGGKGSFFVDDVSVISE